MGYGVGVSQGDCGNILQLGNSTPGPCRTRGRKGSWGGRGKACALPPHQVGAEREILDLFLSG